MSVPDRKQVALRVLGLIEGARGLLRKAAEFEAKDDFQSVVAYLQAARVAGLEAKKIAEEADAPPPVMESIESILERITAGLDHYKEQLEAQKKNEQQ